MQKYPKTDLRASNNIVHVRTCADSCHALGEFINYYANDGDLVEDPEKEGYTEKNKVSYDWWPADLQANIQGGSKMTAMQNDVGGVHCMY